MPGPVVVLKDVKKVYRDVRALDGISFSVEPGEIFGFIGPNGAGKTTTTKIMAGLISDFTGEVLVNGNMMPSARHAASRDIGYMPQQISFQDWRTVKSALWSLGRLSGVPSRDLGTRIKETLDLVGIPETLKGKVKDLSGGTIQKVGFAQALLHRPKVLVLDEPMAGLDPESRYNFKTIIKDLGSKGVSVFFSSHILSDVQDVADRIGILKNGKIAFCGSFDELRSRFGASNDIEIVLSYDNGRWENPKEEWILGIERTGPGRILVRIEPKADQDEAIDRLITGFIGAGCKIRSVNPITPDLEVLYVRFVGGEGR